MSEANSTMTRPVTRSTAAARSVSNYAQVSFTAPSRGRTIDGDTILEQKLLTPQRAGGRHRSPHGGDGSAVDPFMTADLWKSAHLQLSPAILDAKHRLIAVRASLSETPALPGSDPVQPSNADLMEKLDRMMNAMALKQKVQIAHLKSSDK